MINNSKEKIMHVYKFMKISNNNSCTCKEGYVDYYQRFLNLVVDRQLYFSKPSSFNDPFDCFVVFEDKIKIKDFEYYLRKNRLKNFPDGAETVEEAIVIMNSIFKKIGRDIADKSLGVSCFSKNWDNFLLWSHYADSHSGLCVGFKTKYYSKSYCIETDNFPSLVKSELEYDGMMPLVHIQYTDKIPKAFNPYTENQYDLEQFLISKGTHWSYEGEMRAILPDPEKHSRKIELSNTAIDEIVLGANISIENQNKVLEVVDYLDLDISIFKASLDSQTYSIIRNPIN